LLNWLLDPQAYMPHGMCLLWQPGLLALHVVSDGAIALAYFAIPISLAVFLRKRKDLERQHRALAALFGFFITACGLTHVASIVVLWIPLYGAEGILKAITAVASVATAIVLPFLIPQLLRIPSPRALAAEIKSHRATLDELSAARAELADRVAKTESDLGESNRRFEAALRGSPITVFEQDADLIYTWAYNPPLGVALGDVIGRAESDVMTPSTADAVRAVKLEALAARAPRRAEVQIEVAGRAGWFDLRIEPITLRDGRAGIIATSTDITAIKQHEHHLHVVMRELNHRSKNLLTIVLSLMRQTARGFELPPAFTVRMEERLGALANAHDVLASQNWRGADISAVLQGQLAHQLGAYPGRIHVQGPPVRLPPESAHYVGMALHELGSNAVKYGALAGDQGQVLVQWRLTAGDVPELELQWREDCERPIPPPTRLGFGSTILQTLTPRALGGAADLIFEDEGFLWTLRAPMKVAAVGLNALDADVEADGDEQDFIVADALKPAATRRS
jgi:PAS domain S-box-containing protein